MSVTQPSGSFQSVKVECQHTKKFKWTWLKKKFSCKYSIASCNLKKLECLSCDELSISFLRNRQFNSLRNIQFITRQALEINQIT